MAIIDETTEGQEEGFPTNVRRLNRHIERIGGRAYVLSNWAAHLHSRPSGSDFKYLWIFNSSRGEISMYRVTDGDFKVSARGSEALKYLKVLKNTGQINQVTSQEESAVEREMARRAQESMDSLESHIDSMKTVSDREIDAALAAYLHENLVRPYLERLSQVERGALPFGWRFQPDSPFDRERQIKSYLWNLVGSKVTVDSAERYIESLGMTPDDNQTVEFAFNDLMYKLSAQYLR